MKRTESTAVGIARAAFRLLAAREHSRRELQAKLLARGYDAAETRCLLDDLAAQGLLNDGRFADSYVHARSSRGFGPLRIRAELRERGLTEEGIADCLRAAEIDWVEVAKMAHDKRFGPEPPGSPKERARRIRFLEYRGFGTDQIRPVIWFDDPADG